MKILIVEDDQKIVEIILENLARWGYEGVAVSDFSDVYEEFVRSNPHLVLLDINLPYFDGFYWCGKIRQVSKVPVIFISSRNTNMDIIMAINMGGDDFVTKPFSLDILLVKINALLRRAYSYTNTELNLLEHSGVVLNLQDSSVEYQGEVLELTKNEYKILYTLMKNHGNVVSRERIMRSLWEDESFVDDNTLTVNINRLRKRLKDLGLEDWIQTKKNQGYMIP